MQTGKHFHNRFWTRPTSVSMVRLQIPKPPELVGNEACVCAVIKMDILQIDSNNDRWMESKVSSRCDLKCGAVLRM